MLKDAEQKLKKCGQAVRAEKQSSGDDSKALALAQKEENEAKREVATLKAKNIELTAAVETAQKAANLAVKVEKDANQAHKQISKQLAQKEEELKLLKVKVAKAKKM